MHLLSFYYGLCTDLYTLHSYEGGTIIVPISWLKKVRLRKVEIPYFIESKMPTPSTVRDTIILCTSK